MTYIVEVLHIQGLLEAGPLLESEERAELAYTNICSFVGANALHGVGVVDGEGETAGGILIHATCRILKVAWDVGEQVIISQIANDIVVVIVARVVLEGIRSGNCVATCCRRPYRCKRIVFRAACWRG